MPASCLNQELMATNQTSKKYVIITPVRDEEKYLRFTLESVVAQTIRPAECVIVDDGSTDRTGEIIDEYAKKFSWIRTAHRPDRGFRKSGGGVMEAFYEGYNSLYCEDWDFIVKLDGDLGFPPDYFEKCFEYFRKDASLGIGGGAIYHDVDGKLKLEANPRFHVRGATKIYRRACWEAIGGLWPAPGWDTIDEVKANMLGWKTYSFEDLHVLHHRLTGSADGLMRDRVKHGLVCYISGYHPVFLVVSCLRRLIQKPYLIGSAAILYGFVKGFFDRVPRLNDRRVVRYLRQQQLRRLCGLETIWK
jgi:biofilm PGA synthesis N-glycosyltransferase PgaC